MCFNASVADTPSMHSFSFQPCMSYQLITQHQNQPYLDNVSVSVSSSNLIIHTAYTHTHPHTPGYEPCVNVDVSKCSNCRFSIFLFVVNQKFNRPWLPSGLRRSLHKEIYSIRILHNRNLHTCKPSIPKPRIHP